MPGSRLLAVLTSDPAGPVVANRWMAYAEPLEEAGVVLEVVPWGKDRASRRAAVHRAELADGVLVSSRLLRVADTRRLRRSCPRLAFDFDDALVFRDSSRGATRSWTRQRRFRALVRAADAVFAGNPYLADLAARVGREATVLPTTTAVPPGPPSPEPETPPVVLGWIGSRATVAYLETRWVALGALVASGRSFRLRVIADAAPTLPPGIALEQVPWTPDGWQAALEGIHIGVAPLPDDPWTRGKCGLKVLQMMSAGRPVVASGVGVQSEQVVDGVTGFVAHNAEAFLEGLLQLFEDPALRRKMGAAAREATRERWSVEVWTPRVVEAVGSWLGGGAAVDGAA